MSGRWLVVAVLGAVTLGSTAAQAQSIIGRTVYSDTREPVVGVEVQLRDSVGGLHRQVSSDTAGVFRIRAATPGLYRLQVMSLGFATVVSEPLRLEHAALLQIEVLLDTEAVHLEAIRVIAESTMRSGRLAEFFARAERGVRGGNGRIFTRADIEAADYREMRHILLAQPVRRGCAMAFFIDGMPASAREMDAIGPDQVEGVEIYTTRTAVPPQYHNRVVCAATFVWMRRDLPGRPLNWSRSAGDVVGWRWLGP
jgi:hypothetical protein